MWYTPQYSTRLYPTLYHILTISAQYVNENVQIEYVQYEYTINNTDDQYEYMYSISRTGQPASPAAMTSLADLLHNHKYVWSATIFYF